MANKTLEATLKLKDQFTATLKKVDSSLKNAASSMQEFKSKVSSAAQGLNQVASKAASAMARVASSVKSGMSTVAGLVKSSIQRIISLFGNFGNAISSKLNFSAIGSKISSAFSGIKSKVSSALSGIGTMFNKVTGRTKKIAALADIDKQLTSLSRREARVKVKIDEANNVQKSISNIDNSIKQLQAQKAHIKVSAESADTVKSKLAETQRAIDVLKSAKLNLQVKADGLKNSSSQLESLQRQMAKLKNQRVKIDTSAISKAFSKGISLAQNFGSKVKSVFSGLKSSFSQFGSDLKNGFSQIGESKNAAGSNFKGFMGAIGVTKALSAGFNVVKNSVGGAVDRFDTLNQFPKMMQAIGFSAEQAAGSKDKLIEGIDGLPTTLSEVVSTTQQIATMTKDLDGATDTALALNNAMLASGADEDKIARGTEQYLKILSTGKVEMDSFTTLQETMGVALNDVAESFGFAGESAQNDLYKALQSGKIPVKDFNNRMIEMSKVAGGFADRAMIGTEGIKTSFKNMGTAVLNGLEGSIRKFDQFSEALTGKTIAQNLDGVKDKIKGVFKIINGDEEQVGLLDNLPALFEKVRPYIDVLKNSFSEIKEPISEAVSAVKDSLVELTSGFGGEESVSGFQDFVSGITDGIKGLAEFAEEHSDSIAKLITMIPKIAGAFAGFKIGKAVLGPVGKLAKGVGTVAKATGKLGGNIFKSIFGKGNKVPETPTVPTTSVPDASGPINNAGTAASTASKNMLSFAAAAIAVGASILLAAVGFKMLADSAMALADAGGPAIAVFFGMIAAIAILVVILSVFGAGLTAGAVGMLAFGAMAIMLGLALRIAQPALEVLPPIIIAVGMAFSMAAIAIAIATAIVAMAIATLVTAIAGAVATITGAIANLVATIANGISQVAATIGGVLVAVIAQAGESISLIVSTIGESIATVVTSVGELISQIGESLSEVIETISTGISDVTTTVAEGIATVVDSIGGAIEGVLNSVAGVFDSIGNGALNAGKGLKSIASALKEIIGLGLKNVINTFSELKDGLTGLSKNSEELTAVGTAVEQLSTSLSGIEGSSSAFNALAASIPIMAISMELANSSFSTFSGAISQLGGAIMGAIIPLILLSTTAMMVSATLIGAIVGVMIFSSQVMMLTGAAMIAAMGILVLVAATSMVSAQLMMLSMSLMLVAMAMTIVTVAFTTGATQMQSVFTTAMTAIQTSATTAMTALVVAVISGMAQAYSAAVAGALRIASAFNGLAGLLRAAGLNAMAGLTAGIQAGAASAIAAATSVANQVSAAVRSAMDIHSPSRVMMKIGGFVTEGLANGITAASSLVDNASNALSMAAIPSNLGTISASGEVSSKITYDESELSRMQASASQQVVIDNKQVTPQIHIEYNSTGDTEADADALLSAMERKVSAWMDVSLN